MPAKPLSVMALLDMASELHPQALSRRGTYNSAGMTLCHN